MEYVAEKKELDQDGIQWVFQKRASSVWFMLGKSFGLSSFIVTQTGKKSHRVHRVAAMHFQPPPTNN